MIHANTEYIRTVCVYCNLNKWCAHALCDQCDTANKIAIEIQNVGAPTE